VFAAIILLDPHENSYCVPLERSASLVAGLAAAFIMHWVWGHARPTDMEVLGALMLIGAIVLLTLAPKFEQRRLAAAGNAAARQDGAPAGQ
jgi:hypothetical protein